jgi:hypothetical protein
LEITMPTASPITFTRDAPGGAEAIALVERDAAVSVIMNLLAALDAPAEVRPIYDNFGRKLAAFHLAQWGVVA